MFNYKELNVLRGLFYAASCTEGNTDPVTYRQNFDAALDTYFECYPNEDESDNEPTFSFE